MIQISWDPLYEGKGIRITTVGSNSAVILSPANRGWLKYKEILEFWEKHE